jgi:LemA protein
MNRTPNRTRFLAIFAPILLFMTACGVNSIPTAEEQAKAKWADVQNQYQRRADLVGNLVETVRGFANQERDVLTQVTEARASATRITVSPDQLTDPEAMRRFSEAQGRLSSTIIPLQRMQEAYPELRSNELFQTLMSQLEGTENRITVARRDYNEAVRAYNTEIRTFPSIIGARVIYGSQPMQPFEAQEGSERAPRVDFGNRQ